MKVNTAFAIFFATLLLLSGFVRAEAQPTVMVLGDSLSIGYGLTPGQSWPDQAQRLLTEAGTEIRLVNASVSGDTVADGLARLDWALADKPDVCVVALGGNDGLRMLDTERMRTSLEAIVAKLEAAGVLPIIAGMLPPPNFGPDYSRAFGAVFSAVAEAHAAPLVPFLLKGVAGRPELNQPDGIHPTAEGAALVARTMLPVIRTALQKTGP